MGKGGSWLRPLTPISDGPLVFVLPPAGAGSNLFRPWAPIAPPTLELVVVNAPGREERMLEEPFRKVGPLADCIAESVLDYAERPFVIFGHSTGGLVGREVAKRVPSSVLQRIVVAGAVPPDAPTEDLSQATDEELVDALVERGGTTREVLANADVHTSLLRCLRADLAVLRSCSAQPTPDEVLGVPILALAGSGDAHAVPEVCEGWARWTAAAFELRVLPGNHFFPIAGGREVLQLLLAS